MGPAQAIRTCYAKSLQSSGRASRSEDWWFLPVGLALPATVISVLRFARPESGLSEMLLASGIALFALAVFLLGAVTGANLFGQMLLPRTPSLTNTVPTLLR